MAVRRRHMLYVYAGMRSGVLELLTMTHATWHSRYADLHMIPICTERC